MTEQQKLTFTALQQRLDSLMLRDRLRFSRRLHGVKKVKNPDAQQAIFQEMAKEIDQAAGKVLLREAARPEITYPDNLPVSQKKQDILEAIRDHQVVIVAGETGSGKTTQLPKICMELGRGIKGLIGHTQPRRLAARTVANRIAEELKTEPGGCIGYKVRFSDHVSDNTMVKLMTDGILLAEIQQDRLLMQYDTIIIDEAHERSLNIDFLLGYLKELLPRSRHFNNAPIIEVSGRTYPGWYIAVLSLVTASNGWATRCDICRRLWINKLPPARREDEDVKEIRWMIEELRVSYFAQQLGTPYPISDKRILQAMEQISG